MIDRWQLSAHVRDPEKYALYAHGYLDSAISFCEHMLAHEERRTWPNAAVVLLIAAHSVELFLKGAILARAPGTQTQDQRLDVLARRYGELYPQASCSFDVPFRTVSPSVIEIESLALRSAEPVPAIMFRRSHEKKRGEWLTIAAFDAQEFLDILIGVRTSYERIGKSTTPHMRR